MSGPEHNEGGGEHAAEQSVLANLPRARPQRSSARRAAARRAPARRDAGEPAAPSAARPRAAQAKQPRAAGSRPRRRPSAKAAGTANRARSAEAVPSQGFETEGDGARGAVEPPGGTELLGSALEIVGELAKSGVSSSERLLRDVLSRLTR